jgi:hypothetical protein
VRAAEISKAREEKSQFQRFGDCKKYCKKNKAGKLGDDSGPPRKEAHQSCNLSKTGESWLAGWLVKVFKENML